MKQDDYLEIDAHLPAIVVGHKVGGLKSALEHTVHRPPWLVWFEHQHGGHGCDQAQLVGALLPLKTAPLDRAERAELIRKLESLDDSRHELNALAPTWGPYAADQLEVLGRMLTPAKLPAPTKGREALVELDSEGEHFRRWPVLSYEIPIQSHLSDPDGHHLVFGGRQATRDHTVDDQFLAEVTRFLHGLGFDEVLRSYLVWFNSD